jgi:hypothetical protein
MLCTLFVHVQTLCASHVHCAPTIAHPCIAEAADVACWFGAARHCFTPGMTFTELNDRCQVFGKNKRAGEHLFRVGSLPAGKQVNVVQCLSAGRQWMGYCWAERTDGSQWQCLYNHW